MKLDSDFLLEKWLKWLKDYQNCFRLVYRQPINMPIVLSTTLLWFDLTYNLETFWLTFLTFPGPDKNQGTPFTPLALRVHLVSASNLNLVEVASQGVENHNWTIERVNLIDGERDRTEHNKVAVNMEKSWCCDGVITWTSTESPNKETTLWNWTFFILFLALECIKCDTPSKKPMKTC